MAVIGDRSTVAGMFLAGVHLGHSHSDRESTLRALRDLVSSEEVGLVMITYRVAEELGEELRGLMRSKGIFPVVLMIPDGSGYVPKADELGERLRRTIGSEITVER
ncbi:MAG: V-type ATP synthase subunit F [Candidatus Hadarchaeales archaeon]